MKKFLCFLLLAISILSYAQLDREHWFAPMFDGQSNGTPQQYLHLSTNETAPFNVTIYNNNIVINQVSISKGNPAIIPILRSYIITDDPNDLHKVGTMGLYVKADKPCFANLRFRVTNHAEIITSKGTAGIGTKFYTVVAPNLQNNANLGFSASFLATEDQTVVTVDKFKKNLYFNNYGNATSFTFTLNKGQSFMIDGRSITAGNMNGFTGATVTADKPISMSNGNFNGQYATTDNQNGSDILMDQSVPVDKLGDDFVIVKGYGEIGNNMEGAIVVATEKNTSVYLNDATLPIVTLANEGDSYRITEDQYINRGNKHYNLHIKSDKNIYVYQLLGGVENGTTPLATGGMNYIPPLNCYLPKKIDELSYISRMALTDSDYTFLTKLNIITEKGATVKVNGQTPDPMNGPYDISSMVANQKWVTYSIPGVTGNVTVESSKAVTAGIASGNAAFGYGGYFAGFSSIPLILKISGECILAGGGGVTLAVTEGFDSYEWLIKNPDGTYSAASGINNTYTYSPQQAGIYAVKVKQGSCPQVQTADYKFYNCTTYTNYDYRSCGSEIITPTFVLSNQTVNPASIQIITPPSKGTATIGSDGKITYTANPGASGNDYFKFSFCGIGAIPDCETIQITIKMIEKTDDAILQECSTNGIATYNLTLANVSPDNTLAKSYFKTQYGAENNILADKILNFTTYSSADGFIYIRLVNDINCFAVAKVELKSKLPPIVYENLYTQLHCDEEIDGKIDGIYNVNVSSITPIVLPVASNFIVKYYDSLNKANAGLNDNVTGIFSFTANNSPIWIRVDSPNGCPPVIKKILLKTGTPFALDSSFENIPICDNDLNNSENVNLTDYVSQFTNESGVPVKYFDDLIKAQNNNPSDEISVNQILNANKTYYLRFKKSGVCETIGTLNLIFKQPKKSTDLQDQQICPESTADLKTGGGFDGYLWSTGETSESISAPIGEYWVELTSNGCTYKQAVSVTAVSLPKIETIIIQGSTVTINASGGNPPYQYAIDNSNYQPSNVFTNISGGVHTVYVISVDHCEPVSAEINVIQLYNAITPNSDGYNDVLDYSGLLTKNEPFLQIFDRFGKIVFTGDKNNRFIWDGKISGKAQTTGTYWYVMHWKEPGFETVTQFTGWVLVKNRN